jgi:hypothetical protein
LAASWLMEAAEDLWCGTPYMLAVGVDRLSWEEAEVIVVSLIRLV